MTTRQFETMDDMMEEIERLQECLNQTADIERENSLLKASIAELEGARVKGDDSFWVRMGRVQFQGDGMIYRGTACAIAMDADVTIAQLRADLSTARQISRDLIAAADLARGPGVAPATLSNDQLEAVVATWIFRHKGAIEQEPVWALNNLACDVLRAVEDLKYGRPLDVLGAMAAAQPSGEGTGR